VKLTEGRSLAALMARLRPDTAQAAIRQARAGLLEVIAGADAPAAWRSRAPRQRQLTISSLAITFLVLCIVNVATGPRSAAQAVVAIAALTPLLLAARYPLVAWRLGWLALALVPLLRGHWWGGWPWGAPQLLALLVVICMAAIAHQRSVLWWMWALTLVPWSFWLHARVQDLNGPASATVLFTAAVIAVDSFIGVRRAHQDLAEQAELTEAERAQRGVLEERTRIARELHDVVAHHMSLIAVQAETAPYRIGDLPQSAREEFSSMSATAREALADMRRLLGVLRQDQPAALAPQPQLCDVPVLVAAARRAGVSVELRAPPAQIQVPPGVGVCAYRIVQESLSNASQHAPGAPVTVSVSRDGGAMLLQVANGPAGSASPLFTERGAGHGLTGMRERVALLGGSFWAGPAPDGGFVVSAVLPLGETA
jgi:signal transduction histidine kinase